MMLSTKCTVFTKIVFIFFISEVCCGIWDKDWGLTGVASKPALPYYQRFPSILEQPSANKVVARGIVNPAVPKLPYTALPTNPLHTLVHPLTPKKNETEAERAERIHLAFEKMLTLVNIASQVEDYVAGKVKTVVKKVSGIVSSEEDKVGESRHSSKCNHHH